MSQPMIIFPVGKLRGIRLINPVEASPRNFDGLLGSSRPGPNFLIFSSARSSLSPQLLPHFIFRGAYSLCFNLGC
jgi:hypothetical protein